VGMLVLRFPAVASLEYKGWRVLTDERMRALSSLPALTSLDLACNGVTAEGLRVVSTSPHSTTSTHPPHRLRQRVGRGEAGAAHRPPPPDDCRSVVRLLSHHRAAAAPQRTPRSATVYSASRGEPPSIAV
jgi:hypothetical protein